MQVGSEGEASWIEWRGGARPVPADALIEVVERSGRSTEGHRPTASAFWSSWEDSPDYWQDNQHPNDVVAYRHTPKDPHPCK